VGGTPKRLRNIARRCSTSDQSPPTDQAAVDQRKNIGSNCNFTHAAMIEYDDPHRAAYRGHFAGSRVRISIGELICAGELVAPGGKGSLSHSSVASRQGRKIIAWAAGAVPSPTKFFAEERQKARRWPERI
jgi:hypothetical protein